MKTLSSLLMVLLLVGSAHADRPQGEVRNFPDIRPSTNLPGSSYTPLPKKTVTRDIQRYVAPVKKHTVVKRHTVTPAKATTTVRYYYYEQPCYNCQWYYLDGWRCVCLDYLFGGY